MEKMRIGIIICERYHTCAGGKCLRAFYNREGPLNDIKVKTSNLWVIPRALAVPGEM